jgi:hypothetical protein
LLCLLVVVVWSVLVRRPPGCRNDVAKTGNFYPFYLSRTKFGALLGLGFSALVLRPNPAKFFGRPVENNWAKKQRTILGSQWGHLPNNTKMSFLD